MKQLTKEQAIKFSDLKLWEDMSFRERAEFQIEQDLLCMPFNIFHEAITEALGRPVWTHEFASRDELKKELHGEKSPPTLEEILNLIPADKRINILI